MKFAKLTQESLLASEKLIQDKLKAQASTPQAYERFTESSEQEAIEDRDEPGGDDFDSGSSGEDAANDGSQSQLNPEGETADGDPKDSEEASEGTGGESDTPETSQQDEDSQDSDPLADSINNETTQTTEALSDWIKDKTQYSDSKIVRNLGALAAGLAHIGVTYGPMTLNYMFKGMLWTFSRIGTVIFDATKALNNYLEKSRLSMDKLESRLQTAEQAIVSQLNEGSSIPAFTFKNQKAISFLLTSNSDDVTGNIRVFAGSLQGICNGIANEFSSGINIVEKIATSDSSSKVNSLKPMMDVSVPKVGFKPGQVKGYEPNTDLVQQLHTEPLWPGNATVIFNRPVVNSNDMSVITQAYSKADMFVGMVKSNTENITELKSLSGPQAVILAKSIRILLASMKEVSKTQSKMLEMTPKLSLKAKQLFYRLADNKAKVALDDSLVEPMYLRSSLATTVFVNGSTSSLTHASKVAACAIAYLEAHASRITTSTE